MPKLTWTQHAGPYQRFTPEVFQPSLGKRVPLLVDGEHRGYTELIAFSVAEGGQSAELTYLIPDQAVLHAERSLLPQRVIRELTGQPGIQS